jgi:glycosyltransferase involved in cell wall biosynthesis
MSDVALVVVSPDGISSLRNGVGVIVNSFFESYVELARQSSFLQHATPALFAITAQLDVTGPDYDATLRGATQDTCLRTGGDLIEVERSMLARNVTDIYRTSALASPAQEWRYCSKQLRIILNDLAARFEQLVVIVHDIVFASVLVEPSKFKNEYFIWIPHAPGATFTTHPTALKMALESELVAAVNSDRRCYFGAIGAQVRTLYEQVYGVRSDRWIPFENGLLFSSKRYALKPSLSLRHSDRKCIFSFGRCHPQKGFDVILDAWAQIHRSFGQYQLVLLCPSPPDNPFRTVIEQKAADIAADQVVVIFEHLNDAPRTILADPGIDVVVLASRFEANSIAAMEAAAFAESQTAIVYTDEPSLKDRFEGEPNCFSTGPLSKETMIEALTAAISSQRSNMARRPPPSFVANMVAGLDTIWFKMTTAAGPYLDLVDDDRPSPQGQRHASH